LISPSELRAFRPVRPPPIPQGIRLRPNASLKVPSPPALKDRCVHFSRPYLSRYVPPSPFLTTSTFYSASDPCPGLPGLTLMGFLPSRVTPDPPSASPSPVRLSPPDVASAAPALPGASCLAMLPRCASRVSLLRTDRIHQLPVSLPSGTDPLMGLLLVGPSFRRLHPGLPELVPWVSPGSTNTGHLAPSRVPN
jgi:hypothetical protein